MEARKRERERERETERSRRRRRRVVVCRGLTIPLRVRPWRGWGLAGAEGGETMRRMCN